MRLVREHRDDYQSEWAAMKAVSDRLGMNPETLRKWVRQAEIDAGEAPGVSATSWTVSLGPQITLEILKAATSLFVVVVTTTTRPTRAAAAAPLLGTHVSSRRP